MCAITNVMLVVPQYARILEHTREILLALLRLNFKNEDGHPKFFWRNHTSQIRPALIAKTVIGESPARKKLF
jgi:hypothetical protein